MDPVLAIILIVVISVVVGILAFIGGVQYRKKIGEEKIGSAEQEAKRILEDAQRSAEASKKEALIAGKDEAHRLLTNAEKEISDRRREMQRQERRIQQKEESVEKKLDNLEKKEDDEIRGMLPREPHLHLGRDGEETQLAQVRPDAQPDLQDESSPGVRS